jgi:hypothetical protein
VTQAGSKYLHTFIAQSLSDLQQDDMAEGGTTDPLELVKAAIQAGIRQTQEVLLQDGQESGIVRVRTQLHFTHPYDRGLTAVTVLITIISFAAGIRNDCGRVRTDRRFFGTHWRHIARLTHVMLTLYADALCV